MRKGSLPSDGGRMDLGPGLAPGVPSTVLPFASDAEMLSNRSYEFQRCLLVGREAGCHDLASSS
jgi:hypothetical protein